MTSTPSLSSLGHPALDGLDDQARQEDAETSALRYVPESDSGASGPEGGAWVRA